MPPTSNRRLSADTTGISDADGMDRSLLRYQWRRDGARIYRATGSSYTLRNADRGSAISVQVAFLDDADFIEALTSEATAAVTLPPLTVSITTAAPAAHDGSTEFFFEIAFSEEPKSYFSFKTLKFHAFDVTRGTILRAQRLQKDPKSNIPWRITVRPDDNGDVTIVLPVTTDCDNDDGAICTGDGRMLSNRLDLTVPGPGQVR